MNDGMPISKPSITLNSLQRLVAVARLTMKAAFRFKLIPWLLLLLGTSILSIPHLVSHNSTAEMFTQVQLTYSLMAVTVILGVSTVWLSCGVLNHDFQRHHMVLIASKPIHRWEIWLGKWLGILCLNTMLLFLSGTGIYALLLGHAQDLPKVEQERLHQSVLTSRSSVVETAPDEEAEVRLLYQKRSQKASVAAMDPAMVKERLREEVRWMNQLVKPGHRRIWKLQVGQSIQQESGDHLQIRVKFYASWFEDREEHPTVWMVGSPESPQRWERQMNLSPMTTHEWSVPANLIDPDGWLQVECHNYTESSLVFRLEDGMEVLYSSGGFLKNYVMALIVLLSWMALLSALGLWAATFASLPVATFLIMTLVLLCSSEQLFKSIVTEGTISSVDEHSGKAAWTHLDWLMVPVFKVIYQFTTALRSVQPIESLVTGRSIPTIAWLVHLAGLCGILCFFLGGWGVYILQRKELGK